MKSNQLLVYGVNRFYGWNFSGWIIRHIEDYCFVCIAVFWMSISCLVLRLPLSKVSSLSAYDVWRPLRLVFSCVIWRLLIVRDARANGQHRYRGEKHDASGGLVVGDHENERSSEWRPIAESRLLLFEYDAAQLRQQHFGSDDLSERKQLTDDTKQESDAAQC